MPGANLAAELVSSAVVRTASVSMSTPLKESQSDISPLSKRIPFNHPTAF
jgi:hypothetical protein